MTEPRIWNPLTEWKDTKIDWIKVKVSPEDMRRFVKRSDFKGLCMTVGNLLLLAFTGWVAYYMFSHQHWLLLVVALYVHGTFYGMLPNAMHELSHNTVFKSRWLSVFVTALFGWLFWPYNPYFYRASHHKFHHRFTLHQGSDGEDTPNYVELSPKFVLGLFFNVLHVKALFQSLGRLFTLNPNSMLWRGRTYALDTWEQFVLQQALPKELREIKRMCWISLIGHVLFVTICIATGNWFIPILVTFAPFYSASFMGYMASAHQHANCDANNPDFRLSCGDVILDPLTSFLYWRMEYHIEHHMFTGIPCYNLKKFSQFAADQLPPKERCIPRLLRMNRVSREMYGSWQYWRDNFGLYKGF